MTPPYVPLAVNIFIDTSVLLISGRKNRNIVAVFQTTTIQIVHYIQVLSNQEPNNAGYFSKSD